MDQFLVRYNSELANNLGNLVNRTLNMTNRFADAVIPAAGEPGEAEQALQANWERTRDEVIPLFEKFQFNMGLEKALQFITATNAYIEQRAPWKLGKSTEPADQALLKTSLATMAEALRLGSSLLQAVTPGSVDKIRGVLGYTASADWPSELKWDFRLAGNAVEKTCILFPRPEKKN
jgi:methionyl-tRNA synthetase